MLERIAYPGNDKVEFIGLLEKRQPRCKLGCCIRLASVAGRQEHWNCGKLLPHPKCKLEAVQSARHADIAEHEIDCHPMLQQVGGFVTAAGFNHLKTSAFKRFGEHKAYQNLVFNYQNARQINIPCAYMSLAARISKKRWEPFQGFGDFLQFGWI
jgi:hypothetical protein